MKQCYAVSVDVSCTIIPKKKSVMPMFLCTFESQLCRPECTSGLSC
jgi:hypothetical protein